MPTGQKHTTWFVLALLGLLLIANGPLFLCMPIIDDAVLWDLHTREYLHGATPYCDVLETNPPGMLWILAVVRTVLGESSVALRAVDLGIFSLIVVLAAAVLRQAGVTKRGQAWFATAGFFFYFSLSEWCHCQRDMWLLAPSIALVWMRGRQVARLNDPALGAGQCLRHALYEGLVLGAGMWLKPMLVVPAATMWLAGLAETRRWRAVLVDCLGLAAGVAVAGCGGVAWLIHTGAWPFFVDTFVSWNPHYVAAGRQHWTWVRFVGMVVRLFPWCLLHIPAIGAAGAWLIRAGRERRSPAANRDPAELAKSGTARLVAGFYVGWLAQAFLLQHLYDYVQAPGIVLAGLICALALGRPSTAAAVPGVVVADPPVVRNRRMPIVWRPAIVALGVWTVLAVACSPAVRGSRLMSWWSCVTEGDSPAIRDRLRLLSLPDWQDLARVADYLRQQRVGDCELLCFNNSTISLYWTLAIRPPTRYVYWENCLVFFPERTEEMMAALEAARPRYVVSDLLAAGMSRAALGSIQRDARLSLMFNRSDRDRPVLPWSHPITFRAGRYAVHHVQEPLGWPMLTLE